MSINKKYLFVILICMSLKSLLAMQSSRSDADMTMLARRYVQFGKEHDLYQDDRKIIEFLGILQPNPTEHPACITKYNNGNNKRSGKSNMRFIKCIECSQEIHCLQKNCHERWHREKGSEFKCDICCMAFTNNSGVMNHMDSKYHKKKVEEN